MATIHASRVALISQGQDSPQTYSQRRRSPSPLRRRRSRTPDPRRRSRSQERSPSGEDMAARRGRDYTHRDDKQHRGWGRHVSRDRDRRDYNDRRRGSPQYGDYRQLPLPENLTPWRQPQNMYPDRQDKPSLGGRGGDFLENRRLQRETRIVTVWPPSPKAPARSLSPKRSKSSKRSKRPRSLSSTESSSEEERRRRERKEKKRSRKEKVRGSEKKRYRSRSRSQRLESYDNDSNDDSEYGRQQDKREERHGRSNTRSRSRSSLLLTPKSDDEWVVKTSMPPPPVPLHAETKAKALSELPLQAMRNVVDDVSDEEVGPQPIMKINTRKFDERSYGGALLRGEGSAMAAFLQEGTEARIPRRGEIGLTSEEIAKFEDVGYVMSGSRHRRMNAVRIRKENQVISAEEKRGILKLQREERTRRETILREEFNELVVERLKGVPEPRAGKQ